MERSAAPSCLYLIHSLSNSLSERDRRIADYILNDPAKAVHLSIEELAEAAQVSVSTLVRFVKKLGFRGYQQFRIALASEALAPEARIYETIVDSGEDPVRLAFSSASKALEITSSMIDSQDLYKLASRIIEANCVYLFGLGGSLIVAKDALHKLVRTGIRCIGAEDYHMQLMIASQMNQQDTAIIVSHTGANKDAIGLAETIKTTGAFLCVITTYPRSALSRMADMRFISASSGSQAISEAFSARIAQLALIDSLYIAIMKQLGEEGIKNVEKMRATIAKRRI
ncbi:MAG: MurR/RpiR family transcriptional regulator [Spirochaetota bacterium]|jgi:DNA-binding MurR/RpiR family transcriptional regulator|nr:MurR/RpiR family transcriptional regulator [Spirochaetota bacterium]HNP93125.1 MurR/RpiR family transcriptional regulator [Rectinema sp.]HNT59607.1 MurR/RpiR family transcriptional regulator [Rectinema sp.]HPD69701.1 MurR/RpiR family transcriptional regulator [Rectinema sp.]HPG91331.1 MurR/RpiR family transcriptional regulator [Rectinema sp.]